MAHPQLLKWTALVLFFGYAATLVVAGGFGAVLAPRDMSFTLGLHVGDVPDDPRTNLLVQYRFLRGVELAVGLFALLAWRTIFLRRVLFRLFLGVLAAGVCVRLLSLAVDGVPSAAMLSFLAWELVAVPVVFVYGRRTLED